MNKSIAFDQPLRVLAIEDSMVDQALIEGFLKELGSAIERFKIVETLKAGFLEIENNIYDVVLLDLNLKDSQGENTLLEFNDAFPNMPLVINTGVFEDVEGLQMLNSGAQDFLIKGKYNAYLLNKVLHYAVERKRREDDLKEMYLKLTEANAQIVQMEKFKTIGALAAGIAHEVRNPLATILWGVTYLDENLENNDEKISTAIQGIKDAANRGDEIVSNFLDFAKLSKVKLSAQRLNVLVDHSEALLNHIIKDRNIQIEKDCIENLPLLQIDQHRIEQVIINLLMNAIQASPDSSTIRLKIDKTTLPDNYFDLPQSSRKHFSGDEQVVVLSITDQGVGIPEDKLHEIFDPFFSTKRTEGGLGLGLSICQHIMDIHKGFISLENIEGSGARACLAFPLT